MLVGLNTIQDTEKIQLLPVIQYGGRKTGNYFFRGVITYDQRSAPSEAEIQVLPVWHPPS